MDFSLSEISPKCTQQAGIEDSVSSACQEGEKIGKGNSNQFIFILVRYRFLVKKVFFKTAWLVYIPRINFGDTNWKASSSYHICMQAPMHASSDRDPLFSFEFISPQGVRMPSRICMYTTGDWLKGAQVDSLEAFDQCNREDWCHNFILAFFFYEASHSQVQI